MKRLSEFRSSFSPWQFKGVSLYGFFLQHDMKHPSLHLPVVELTAQKVAFDSKLDLRYVQCAVCTSTRDDPECLLLLQTPRFPLLELHIVLQYLNGLLHVQSVQVQGVVITLSVAELQ